LLPAIENVTGIQMQNDPVLENLFAKFAEANACWFSSVRPDGRAHLAPIWHVVFERRIYVVSQESSVRVQNIRRNPNVSLSLPDTSNVLIVEGVARIAPERRDDLRAPFRAKYDWDTYEDASYTVFVEVRPTKVMAWGTDGEGRWRLDDSDA
jgi:general stress protein 26